MIEGKNIIGFDTFGQSSEVIKAVEAASGQTLEGEFHTASDNDVALAMSKAAKAFPVYRSMSSDQRAEFLDTIGDEIMALGDELIQRAMAESALPEARITGERGRTVNQLKLFASLLREGSWVEASIDTAIPDRQPIPKPDVRKMLVAIGPVVVFTASNFPLAFSTAGGDTASALAGGNPVIVKAHESHLGTNELIAKAISRAAEKCGMPDGTFSTLVGKGYQLGEQLVTHPEVKAVAFTGSFRGGKALYDLATKRSSPIPVFAEMGSINPVLLFSNKLEREYEQIATTYAGSITLGVGQFCTNPGLIIGVKSEGLSHFEEVLSGKLEEVASGCMLNEGIATNYQNQRAKMRELGSVEILKDGSDQQLADAMLLKISADEFLKNPAFSEEVFGPYSLIVECQDYEQMEELVLNLEGQLTATVMADENELEHHKELFESITDKVGRIIYNGAPTGVEVCHSMHHGGPYPATTDSRFTSVGTAAIKRFVRPVCYQDIPDNLLPDELKHSNPLDIWRLSNGNWSKD